MNCWGSALPDIDSLKFGINNFVTLKVYINNNNISVLLYNSFILFQGWSWIKSCCWSKGNQGCSDEFATNAGWGIICLWMFYVCCMSLYLINIPQNIFYLHVVIEMLHNIKLLSMRSFIIHRQSFFRLLFLLIISISGYLEKIAGSSHLLVKNN